MDFSSSSWMSSIAEGQTVTRSVDGHVFTITSSGNIVYINGFPVTVDQWNQAVKGKEVKLSFQGKQAILSSVGSNIMFNGNSMTTGKTISNQVTFGSTSSTGPDLSSSSSSSSTSSSSFSGSGKFFTIHWRL